MFTLAEAQAMAASISQGSTASYLFEISEIECDLSVVSFSVEEQISSPFQIDITLATQDEIIFEDFLDKEGLLTIDTNDSERFFHGVVRECSCLGDQGGYSIIHMHLVPSIWLLSLEQDCRIFQNMKTKDIILQILKESRIDGDRVRLALKDTERKREYCVQYRETDLNFITRLLEDEGIFYFFEHYEDGHVIVFADNPAAYQEIDGESEILFNIESGNVPGKESITEFIYSHRLYPGKVTQRDFNYNRVSQDLTTNKKTKKTSEREIYDYPGNYFKQTKGNESTKIHQERIQVLGETAEGQSNCPRLIPGSVWTLTNSDFEGDYLTVGVEHNGSQPQVLGEQASGGGFQYSNNFIVIPSEAMFRPQIVAERPIISGVQTATVVGLKGEEIHTDDLGRVKVQFHWDRLGEKNDNSSCWIRVAQSWGGLGRGSQYIPRVGDEVVVEFAEGDPDRPIIIGSIYNGDNQPINSLKQSITQSGFRTKTHKGDGFHELRFDDAKGKEEIYLQSEKDWNTLVKNRRGMTIGGSSGTVIGGNCNKLVGGNHYTCVGGARTEIAKQIILGGDESITIVCGGSSIVMNSSGIKINGPRVDINDGGGASMPGRMKVSGNQGAGGGGASKKDESSPDPAEKPAAKQDDDWKAGPVVDRKTEEVDEEADEGVGGGWTEVPTGGWPSATKLPTGVMDELPREAPSSGVLKRGKAGLANITGNLPSLSSVTSFKDKAVGAVKSKAVQEMGNLKGALLEKSGVNEVKGKLTSLSEKPASLVKAAKITSDDITKKF